MLLQKLEQLSARLSALEADNQRLKQSEQHLQADNALLKQENQLLRQKLEHYIRHYFGGQRNEGLDKHQLELLLQGLPNVIVLPAPEPKPAAQRAPGKAHPVRRVLAEDKLETQ